MTQDELMQKILEIRELHEATFETDDDGQLIVKTGLYNDPYSAFGNLISWDNLPAYQRLRPQAIYQLIQEISKGQHMEVIGDQQEFERLINQRTDELITKERA